MSNDNMKPTHDHPLTPPRDAETVKAATGSGFAPPRASKTTKATTGSGFAPPRVSK